MKSLFVKREKPKYSIENVEPIKERATEFSKVGFSYLRKDGNNYYFTNTVPFHPENSFKQQTIEKVFSFAYKMSFGGEGEHRASRSGGIIERKNGEIFANTFQGKLAECAACNYFFTLGYKVTPDFRTYKLGKWDTVDVSVGNREIAIKSTKSFGQLLLLETADWDENARYIPNKKDGTGDYDAFLLIRIKPSSEDILKQMRVLYSHYADYQELKRAILDYEWTYHCIGFVTREDLKYIISNKYILPQGAMLNERTEMDATNYYVQSGDMRPMSELKHLF